MLENKHKELFFKFVEDLNDNDISYYFLRGFGNLPEKPDTDIDLVCKASDWNDFTKIADKHLSALGKRSFGFAEYSEMLYFQYSTKGEPDSNIPNGFFQVDSYNCLFMLSPAKGFTTYWTLPTGFNDYVFNNIKKIDYDTHYYIPSVECEIALLVFRNVLDLRGAWKQKHIDRIKTLKKNYKEEELLNCIKMVLPSAQKVTNHIADDDYGKIFNTVMQ